MSTISDCLKITWWVYELDDGSIIPLPGTGGGVTLNQKNTINVMDMSFMFAEAGRFNQPVNFNTRSVTNMSCMFYMCKKYNSYCGNWDVSSVTNMSFMFFILVLDIINNYETYYCKN